MKRTWQPMTLEAAIAIANHIGLDRRRLADAKAIHADLMSLASATTDLQRCVHLHLAHESSGLDESRFDAAAAFILDVSPGAVRERRRIGTWAHGNPNSARVCKGKGIVDIRQVIRGSRPEARDVDPEPPPRRTTHTLEEVERLVSGSKGMSVSDVALALGIKPILAGTWLRHLRSKGRICMAGDRRFARYAADQATANASSMHARLHAAGPVLGAQEEEEGGVSLRLLSAAIREANAPIVAAIEAQTDQLLSFIKAIQAYQLNGARDPAPLTVDRWIAESNEEQDAESGDA